MRGVPKTGSCEDVSYSPVLRPGAAIFANITTVVVIIIILVIIIIIINIFSLMIGPAFPSIPEQFFATRVDMMAHLSDSAVDTTATQTRRSLPRGIYCQRQPRDNP